MAFNPLLRIALVCALFFNSGAAFAQLIGRITDIQTKQPVSYVNYYNLRTEQGGLSDEAGNFRITQFFPSDTIEFSIIGYKTLRMKATDIRARPDVQLTENLQLLREVPVLAYDKRWHNLLLEARSNFSEDAYSSKSYYLLESFRDSQQVELLECFFNATIEGPDMGNLQMKSGRFGLNPKDGQVFLSQDISAAIIQMKTTELQRKMPVSPLQLNRKLLKKAYYIRPVQEYTDENGSNIIVLEAEPNRQDSTHFSGKIWIDTKYNTILKTIWNIEQTQRHPLLPIFPDDTILYVNLTVTKTFETTGKVSSCNRVDFQYELLYKAHGSESPFLIRTNAILNAYKRTENFNLAHFNLPHDISDYRKIQALPSQDYFWSHHNEMIIENKRESNEAYLREKASLNQSNLFTEGFFDENDEGFRWLYYKWSPSHRIFSRDINRPGDQSYTNITGMNSEKYHLGVQFYLDIYDFTDTTVLLSAVIMDPYTSFYHLPMDSLTFCFINVYFDLMEIKRLEFVSTCVQKQWDKARIWNQFEIEKMNIKNYQSWVLKDLQRGNNLQSLITHNDYIKEKLGIDNMAIFGIQRQ